MSLFLWDRSKELENGGEWNYEIFKKDGNVSDSNPIDCQYGDFNTSES